VRVIVITDGSLVSLEEHAELAVVDDNLQPDPEAGIAKIAMIDRVSGSGDIGVAFVKGFGITEGAIGSSANVFNQQVVVVGMSDEDMAVAANAIVEMKGGFVAVRDGEVVAKFPTPLNGIVSDLDLDQTRTAIDDLLAQWRAMGCRLATPQINLEFVTLVTIPELRISTKGLALVRADSYEFVDVLVTEMQAV
jgi:adenine deaminase